jgi:hypothetical protein
VNDPPSAAATPTYKVCVWPGGDEIDTKPLITCEAGGEYGDVVRKDSPAVRLVNVAPLSVDTHTPVDPTATTNASLLGSHCMCHTNSEAMAAFWVNVAPLSTLRHTPSRVELVFGVLYETYSTLADTKIVAGALFSLSITR